MSNKALLCDIGGTHARLAVADNNGGYTDFQKYRLDAFQSFESIIDAYIKHVAAHFSVMRVASARTVVEGRITYQRHAGDPDYQMDFNAIKTQFGFDDMDILNDLEAAAYGLQNLGHDQVDQVVDVDGPSWSDGKTLLSIGTGAGHAYLNDNKVIETCGGHFLPVTVTEEQRAVEAFIRKRKDSAFALIMEDFVSGRGLRAMVEFVSGESNEDLPPENFIDHLKNHPEAIRLFFEFLGLHAHMLVSTVNFYGGVYCTGGVIDHLVKAECTDWAAFEKFFRPEMVSVVNQRLGSCPVYYVLHDELPLLGLARK